MPPSSRFWSTLADRIHSQSANHFITTEPLHGGTIHLCYRLDTETARFFVKIDQAQHIDRLRAERDGLLALRDTPIRVPAPLFCGVLLDWAVLVLEFIPMQDLTESSEAQLGEKLATLHGITDTRFGWPSDNWIGTTPQYNARTDDWMDFFWNQRLRPQLLMAHAKEPRDTLLGRSEEIRCSLEDRLTGYQPLPSLLHGDLWSGNRGYTKTGEPILFDPAPYYGDRETDIAMSELFGGFSPAFHEAYRAQWPLHPGYPSRRPLYQLYHVLNHFNLFGGAYRQQLGTLWQQLRN